MIQTKDIVSFLAYSVAAIGAFVFLHQVFDEYFEGKSAFTTSFHPVAAKDIPTLTLCYYPRIDNNALQECYFEGSSLCDITIGGFDDDPIFKYR